MATISQRISLEGSEDIRKQLLALGQAGEQAFKQIQDAAAKPIGDAAQLDKTRQVLNDLVATTAKLAPQLQTASTAADKAGASLQTVAESSNLAAIGIVALGSALGTGLVAVFGKIQSLVASFSISELTKGAVETAKELSDQAGKINLSTEQWLQLRRALESTTMSWDDAVKGLTKLGEVVEHSQAGLKRWQGTVVQTADGEVTIRKFSGAIANTTTIAGKAAAALRELGASAATIASGNKLAIMQEVAVAINKIPGAADRAERGLRVFGKNWEDIIKSLIASKRELEANKDLMPEQVAQLKKLSDAWDKLGTTVRAVKDQIGLLFVGPATARAEWLTTLADGVRKLVIQFSQLSEAKREAFLGGLGGSPAETAFKVLIAVGQQLAGLWNQVLVPAGQKLMEIVRSIAGSFEGVSGSQVAAFFITAAIAATALAIALKGIALVLSPLATLFSLAFSPLGIILIAVGVLVVAFWDKFKAVAKAALALIPQELQQMKAAFAKLFKGDFSGFWKNFSAAAVSAFQKIKGAAQKTDIGRAFIDALGSVKTAAIGMAAVLGLIFGRRVTAAAAGAVLAIAQVTGALDLLKNVVGIVAPVITGLLVSVGALVTIFGGIPVAIGLAVFALGALLFYLNPKVFKEAAAAVGQLFSALAKGDVKGAQTALSELGTIIKREILGIGKDAGDSFGKGLMEKIGTIAKTFGTAVLNEIKAALTPETSLWDAIVADFKKFEVSFLANVRILGEKIRRLLSVGQAQAAEAGPGQQTQTTQEIDKVATSAQIATTALAEIAATLAQLDPSKLTAVSQALDFSAVTTAAQTAATELQVLFFTAAQQITETFSSIDIASALSAQIDSLVTKFGQLASAAAAAASAAASVASSGGEGGGTAPAPFAHGGLFGGRGTGTSDSNLAWVSRGEHIMPARAVRQPGVLAFLEALRRSGGDLSRILDGMGRFALGGLVPQRMAIPAFANGGPVGSMSNVTIQFPGVPPISGLRASSDVVDQLHKAAALAQVRSGGRKPSRYS